LDPSDELAEIVCRSVLDELVLERPDEAIWRWLAGRLARW
jgi:hypothetical protein